MASTGVCEFGESLRKSAEFNKLVCCCQSKLTIRISWKEVGLNEKEVSIGEA